MTKKKNSILMEEITEDDVNKILEAVQEIDNALQSKETQYDFESFVRGYDSVYKYSGAYSSHLQNEIIKGLNFNPNSNVTPDKVTKALNNPKTSEKDLIEYGQHFYSTDMVFKRNVHYLKDLNIWDLAIIPKYSYTTKERASTGFKADWKRAGDFLSKFNYRSEFTKCLQSMVLNESCYVLFRDDMSEDNYLFQELPYKYCKMVNRNEWGLLYDFDYNFFLNPSVDINLYNDDIKRKYDNIFTKQGKVRKNLAYIPSNSTDYRNGQSSLWVQTSNEAEGFWQFKLNPDNASNIPMLSPLLSDLILVPIYRNLQKNANMVTAKKLLVSQYPLMKDKNGSKLADQLAVSPETFGKFMAKARQGLDEAIQMVSFPSDKIEGIEFENKNPELYDNFVNTISNMMAGGNVLFQQNKSIIFQAQLALDIDANMMKSVYPQFEKFLECQINKLTRKYQFTIKLTGSNTFFHKKEKTDRFTKLAQLGVASYNDIANVVDKNIFELTRELELEETFDFIGKLKPIMLSTQMSKDESVEPKDKGGRPSVDDSEKADSTESTQDSGSNQSRGGQI